MSTNPNPTNEENALYQSMLRAMWVSAISAVIAVLTAATFGIYSVWQTNQLLQKEVTAEPIYEIDASPAEILESLNLPQRAAITATTEPVLPSAAQPLELAQGNLTTAGDHLPEGVDPALNHSLFALIDGHFVPVEIRPAPTATENTEVLYVRIVPSQAGQSGAEGFNEAFTLESADYSILSGTGSMLPAQVIAGEDASLNGAINGTQQQDFAISFETTEGTKTITIFTW